MTTENGGPAFPIRAKDSEAHEITFLGMSLRDWFAGMALNGTMDIAFKVPIKFKGKAENDIAELVYKMADAMLAEREKK